jgi:hypothetical protein
MFYHNGQLHLSIEKNLSDYSYFKSIAKKTTNKKVVHGNKMDCPHDSLATPQPTFTFLKKLMSPETLKGALFSLVFRKSNLTDRILNEATFFVYFRQASLLRGIFDLLSPKILLQF